jgi:hypothetical protein
VLSGVSTSNMGNLTPLQAAIADTLSSSELVVGWANHRRRFAWRAVAD